MSFLRLTRRNTLQVLGVAALAAGAGSLAVLLARRAGERSKKRAKEEKYLARVPSAPATWVHRVGELHERLGQRDYAGAAKSAGYLTDIAFTAADRIVQAWLGVRENYRGLLPRQLKKESDHIWNYRDCAADLYCHLVIEASLIAPAHLPALRDILAKERAITEGLPHGIRLIPANLSASH